MTQRDKEQPASGLLDAARKEVAMYYRANEALGEEVMRLQAENERLRETLAIYATRTNWTCARGYESPRIYEHEWRTAAAAMRTTEPKP